jgi:HK97 gp10 family phage protein
MDTFKVDVVGLESFVTRYRNAPRIISDEMRQAGAEVGTMVERAAKGYAPVKTGHLRRSITHSVTASSMVTTTKIGTNVPYAKYVEFGRGPITAAPGRVLRFEIGGVVLFRKSVGPAKARPFLFRAFREMRGRIQQRFRQVAPRSIARIVGGR